MNATNLECNSANNLEDRVVCILYTQWVYFSYGYSGALLARSIALIKSSNCNCIQLVSKKVCVLINVVIKT